MARKCEQFPIPHMWIDDPTSTGRKTRFMKNQWFILSSILSEGGPYLFYNSNDLLSMFFFFEDAQQLGASIGALRLYFAVYSDKGQPSVPNDFENMFTFIFAPATADGKDIGRFFTIAPGDSFNPARSEITPTVAKEWVLNWQNGLLTKLPVDKTNPDNCDAKGRCSDSRSVVYTWDFLKEARREIQCQQADGVKIYLSSFMDTEKKYPKRTTTQIVLADQFEKDLPIDMSYRHKQEKVQKQGVGIFDLDTANPCPPALGCNGSTLGGS